jgi:hypothetical protein
MAIAIITARSTSSSADSLSIGTTSSSAVTNTTTISIISSISWFKLIDYHETAAVGMIRIVTLVTQQHPFLATLDSYLLLSERSVHICACACVSMFCSGCECGLALSCKRVSAGVSVDVPTVLLHILQPRPARSAGVKAAAWLLRPLLHFLRSLYFVARALCLRRNRLMAGAQGSRAALHAADPPLI